jgi:transglutaminase-like putative cysteine protease
VGCAQSDPEKHSDIYNEDSQIDYAHPEKYLNSGTQSTITEEEFTNIDQQLQIKTIDLSAIKKIYAWKQTQFDHVRGGGRYVGKQAINDILKEHVLTGCHDHGLGLVSVLRKYGVPAILVDATGIEWALQYPEKVRSFRGHVFVEIFLNNTWMLFDSTSGVYIPDYDPSNPVIPITNPDEVKGYYVMFKGLDPEDYGITNIKLLNKEQQRYARLLKEKIDQIIFPKYSMKRL